MPTLPAFLHHATAAKRLSRVIFWAGVLTLLVMGVGSGFALYKNWEVRLEASQSQMVRSSEMANMLVERTLLDATEGLDASKREFEVALDKGSLTPQQAYLILMQSNQGRSVHDQSKPMKLLFWIDAVGSLVARSDEYPKGAVDYSDRLYFQDLQSHPEKRWTIGPLMLAAPNGQWAFHIAIPLHDRRGKFEGILVQQLLMSELSRDLATYLDPSDLGQVVTHFNGGAFSISFRGFSQAAEVPDAVVQIWSRGVMASPAIKGNHIWALQKQDGLQQTVLGFAKSPLFGLVTYVTLPMATLVISFLWDNHYLLIYVALGMLLVVVIFHQAFGIAVQMSIAVDKSLHDSLTSLHNRRALDETLPHLLRASMRSQSPVSVLFMDIDHFRRFNEEFGHETGDIALVAVSKALALCCRRPMDLLCRWGGEEFVAVLPDTNAVGAGKIARDMLNAVRNISVQSASGQTMHVTISIGSVTATVTETNRTDDLIDCADKAMQTAKSRGRDQYAVWQATPALSPTLFSPTAHP
jgi:diguanylate cyclase (GGDEF)-like protein